MPRIRSVHERAIAAPSGAVGSLIDQLSSAGDRLWPSPRWPPMRFDRPLGVGAQGGHGPIRYRVSAYDPGWRLRLTFAPTFGISGYHELEVLPVRAEECLVRHVLEGKVGVGMLLRWLLVIRWLHDALVEDLLDNAERITTGGVAHPARWSPWVPLLRRSRAGRLAAGQLRKSR